MTQNLDYNGGGTSTAPANWGNDDDKARYYDPGDYVYTTPTEINNCGIVSSLADCTGKNWTKVGTGTTYTTASTNPNMTNVLSGSTYDAHYHIGNYYSWLAATNGSGKDLWEDGAEAPGSICPKNWKLPLSGDSAGSNNDRSGSFRNLLSKYGFKLDKTDSNGLVYDDIISSTAQNIAASPLYFLRGGNVDTASMYFAGINSLYWSRTASSGATAYYLIFGSATVYPSFSGSHYLGFSIRCVVI